MVQAPGTGIPAVQRHRGQCARGGGVQAVAKCCHAVRHLCCTCPDDAGAKPRRCPAAERISNGQRAVCGTSFVRQVASPLAGARTLLGDRGDDFHHRPLAQGSIPPRAGQIPEREQFTSWRSVRPLRRGGQVMAAGGSAENTPVAAGDDRYSGSGNALIIPIRMDVTRCPPTRGWRRRGTMGAGYAPAMLGETNILGCR